MRGWLVVATVRFGAALGCLATYAPPLRVTMGPGGRPWERLRRLGSRLFGAVFDERAGPRPITYGEYAGRFDGPLAELEYRLWSRGFRRNPLSRLKTRDGTPECGSWAVRESPLADRQVHLMLFRDDDDGVDVYAHEELSSLNPSRGIEHFDGVSMNVAAGVHEARKHLGLDTDGVPSGPPAGHWSLGPRTRADAGVVAGDGAAAE